MFTFLLVVQALIAALLVGVILMQQSEGGGLGMGGSPSGLMSARGAANFLTRATTILACLFVGLSIALAVLASQRAAPTAIDTSLKQTQPIVPVDSQPAVPLSGAIAPAAPVTGTAPPPVPASTNAVPLAAPAPQPRAQQQAAPKPHSETPKPVAQKPVTAAPPRVVTTVTPSTPKPALSADKPAQPAGPPPQNN